jgi:hypothetical protein
MRQRRGTLVVRKRLVPHEMMLPGLAKGAVKATREILFGNYLVSIIMAWSVQRGEIHGRSKGIA